MSYFPLISQRSPRQRAKGLTLLEVLIALSIFSMIGLASYQVLTSTIASQQVGDDYSQQLARQQKALMIIDRDLQQLVARDIRVADQQKAFLLVNEDEYPLEFTRGGWRNPLQQSRSSLQRVAYDVGLHPGAENIDSKYYQSEERYLRRHLWAVLDREEGVEHQIQVLLAGVEELTVAVISDGGRALSWPSANQAAASSKQGQQKQQQIRAIELSINSPVTGDVLRLYPVGLGNE